jgi:hypothetical protein
VSLGSAASWSSYLLLTLGLSTCRGHPSNELAELERFGAREFELVGALNGAPVLFPSGDVFLHYDASQGTIGTNAFGNLYSIDVTAAYDGALDWGGVQGTLIAVPENLADAAFRYTSLIIETRRVEQRADGMALLSRDGTKALDYRYAARP